MASGQPILGYEAGGFDGLIQILACRTFKGLIAGVLEELLQLIPFLPKNRLQVVSGEHIVVRFEMRQDLFVGL